jgi:hypothetical protein
MEGREIVWSKRQSQIQRRSTAADIVPPPVVNRQPKQNIEKVLLEQRLQ